MVTNRILLCAAALLSLGVQTVVSLQCVQCTSYEDGDDCWHHTMSGKNCPNEEHDDLCYVITTALEEPNDGPQDRLKDNDYKYYITRGCGNKASLDYIVKVDKCYGDSIGGGGEQETCLCSGNNCNSGASIAAGVAVVMTALLTKLVL